MTRFCTLALPLFLILGQSAFARPAQPQKLAPAIWDYRVDPSPDMATLRVDAQIEASPGSSLVLALPEYLEDLELETNGRWTSLDDWELPQTQGRKRWHLRYRYRLRDAARSENDPQQAGLYGGVIVSPCSSWLLHPEVFPTGDYRLKVVCPAEISFDCGVNKVGDDYRAPAMTLEQTPASVLGPVSVSHLQMGGSQVEFARTKGAFQLGDPQLLGLVKQRLSGIINYFGRFPVRRALLVILPTSSRHLRGIAIGSGGASVVLLIPTRQTAEEVLHNWELTHELIHLAFPSLPSDFHWAEEGLATYLEPVIRARSGELKPAEVWSEFMDGAKQSEPERSSDLGLDGNGSWAQTYWGGAMFWLLADVQIRKATAGKYSLQTALRSVLAQGGNITQEWPFAKVIRLGDRATTTSVLADLHSQMGPKPDRPSLKACFALLGIEPVADSVRFEKAPLDWIRQSITKAEARSLKAGSGRALP